MTAADDLTEAALDAVKAACGVLDVDIDGIPESQWRVLVDAVLAVPAIDAVLAVPAIADALAVPAIADALADAETLAKVSELTQAWMETQSAEFSIDTLHAIADLLAGES